MLGVRGSSNRINSTRTIDFGETNLKCSSDFSLFFFILMSQKNGKESCYKTLVKQRKHYLSLAMKSFKNRENIRENGRPGIFAENGRVGISVIYALYF